jgi:hypothetical protein
MTLARAADIVGAESHGCWWGGVDCPTCGTPSSVALSDRGWECRWDACRDRGTDLRVLVARWLAVRGMDRHGIVRVLRER